MHTAAAIESDCATAIDARKASGPQRAMTVTDYILIAIAAEQPVSELLPF